MITYLHDEVLEVVAGGGYQHPKPQKPSSSVAVFIGNSVSQAGNNDAQTVAGGFASKGGTIYVNANINQTNGDNVRGPLPAH